MNMLLLKIQPILYGALLLISCNAQEKPSDKKGDIEDCENNYKKADKYVNDFVFKADTISLNKVLSLYSKSMKCNEFRNKSITKKIAYLIILEDYKNGSEFIDSLKTSDFQKTYKKSFYHNLFKAKKSKDSTEVKKYYSNIIRDIKDYLSTQSSIDEPDLEAYHDLYYIKSQYEEPQKIEKELDELIVQYPEIESFINNLKEELIYDQKDSNPYLN